MTSDKAILILKRDNPNNIAIRSGFEDLYDKRNEAFSMAIKSLEHKSIIDKIRAEIEELDVYYDTDYFSGNKDAMFKCNEVLEIIDKYRTESEDKKK